MSEPTKRPGGTPEGAIEVDAPQALLKPVETHDASPAVIITSGRLPDGTGFFLLRSVEHVSEFEDDVKYFQRRWWEGPGTIRQVAEEMRDALGWYIENCL